MPKSISFTYKKMALFHSYVGSFSVMWKSQLGKRNWESLDSIPCEVVCEMEMHKLTHLASWSWEQAYIAFKWYLYNTPYLLAYCCLMDMVISKLRKNTFFLNAIH